MTELSWPWDGTSLGDATTSPYSASEYAQFVRTAIDDHGVAPNARLHIPVSAFGYSSLLVSGTASPVSIAAGYAYIAGFTYINDASTTLAVSTPGANPRKDRVILRINWAAQTIRLVLLAGTEAATPSPPALTQTIGTTYEVSLAQINVTTGGVITVLDERPGFMGLGPGVFFRDIRDRVLEEFFDNFSGGQNAVSAGSSGDWFATLVSGTIDAVAFPSSIRLATTATANRSARMSRGNQAAAIRYQFRLSQAPLLFEAYLTPANAAIDANAILSMRFMDSAGTSYIEFGAIGSISTANLSGRAAAGGAATNFTTGTAIDASGAYHKLGIYLAAAAGPAVLVYDGVPIGQIATGIPASATSMTTEFFVQNGATAANRIQDLDWARLVRGS